MSHTPGTRGGVQFLWDPTLRPLLRDPAIEPLLIRHGWMAYWTEAGVAPDTCREATPPPFCRYLPD